MRKPDVDLRALDRLLAVVFGSSVEYTCRRTATGSSTQVYRVDRGTGTFYVRIAESAGDSFAPEVALHRALRTAGANVPAVVHYEPFCASLARSVMVTTEIAGGPMNRSTPGAAAAKIGRGAGRDLARIHGVAVQGFGWIMREHATPGWPLRAEHATYASYVDPASVGDPLLGIGFDLAQAQRVESLLEEAIAVGPAAGVGRVAHGDFDTSHIFQSRALYTGLIDFGEIRGTDYTFDFATLILSSDEHHPASQIRRHVEAGYSEIRALPEDHERRLYLACILSATHRLCGWFRRDGPDAARGPFFRWIRDRLADLLDSERLAVRD
ncbi:aminoglycoside phosphotransferase family protein [Actinopolymorpha pittospori]|uniref:Ser/Thr protein kinase RdoA (MazF antagonist) n=1 Tax=Actinopolymorpha pittospori TaxID=648752 RepID=A0A927N6D6_9ACTN|nr:aminoglycoside phosphotransferase family protein [Actinopolymorpha pittospori]MBE1612924.1 Ser/Thr protein kinase RdoA (MazF antagonist) [Actinopolymorpha pittospori]